MDSALPHRGTPSALVSDRLAVLTYHSLDDSGSVVSVSPTVFVEHMDALAARGVSALTLSAALACREREGRWPRDAVVITFDDGYANVHEHALPILRQRGFRATIFVITGHVGATNNWAARPPRLPELSIASWQQINELDAAGWEIAAHTHTHPDLRQCAAVDIEGEYRHCNEAIAVNIGRLPRTFAYPYGRYSNAAFGLASKTYSAAVTTKLARAGSESRHLLPRIDMFYVRTADQLTRLIRGQSDSYLTLRRIGRRIRERLS